ncbi:MAG: two-component system C4-dicarboxylate transport sensor histidine kinase DctB [Paracoccaceae bacterium]|jgi:two-component system C4-dicarboxylate transport sensor histidine kinase DctB
MTESKSDLSIKNTAGGSVIDSTGQVTWRVKLTIIILIVLAVCVVFYTNKFLTERFTEVTRNRAELRLALYSGNILTEVQRTSIVPLLLARDPELVASLQSGDFTSTSRVLISFQNDIGVASITLLDKDGRVVAATDRTLLGSSQRSEAYFVAAQRQSETLFDAAPAKTGGYDFTYSRSIMADNRTLGVIVVSVDLMRFERSWAGLHDAVLVTDSQGTIILATQPRWRDKTIEEAVGNYLDQNGLSNLFDSAKTWTDGTSKTLAQGAAVLQVNARVPFRGWRIYTFTAYNSVRERVNGFLALEIMGFAIFLAIAFYYLSRRAWSRSITFQRESADLRSLNVRLQTEISERKKVQKTLEVAELTLAQSLKLAALGQMSAAVSHELSQPLAAMKTYLAGARLLLQRRRAQEALSSFQRIDDLIDRMGAITRQLKSYARKGGEAFEAVDFRDCVSSALTMMEPQLKQRVVRISRDIPRKPMMVMADRIRLEQVIINLLRNALDATKSTAEPQIELIMIEGEAASLLVKDNGTGIAALDNVFEPFYTTKKAGEGVGLGLAISSGIISDLSGRLAARNRDNGGAVFEIQLPLIDTTRS